MTVGRLIEALKTVNPDTLVAVYRQDAEGVMELYDISEVSLLRGTPKRDEADVARFQLEDRGAAEWLFLRVDES